MQKNKQQSSNKKNTKISRPLILIGALISVTGCATNTTPKYLPPPSAKKSSSDYTRQQIASPAKKQILSAFVTGFVAGALGPLGSIVSNVTAKYTQKKISTGYWKSFSNTELVGVVIEDATEKRLSEYKNKADLFTHLPAIAAMPNHYSVDFGSGNFFILPVHEGLKLQVGDVVTAYVTPDAWKIVADKIDYTYLPKITAIRCLATDNTCISAPENEPGIAKRLGLASED